MLVKLKLIPLTLSEPEEPRSSERGRDHVGAGLLLLSAPKREF